MAKARKKPKKAKQPPPGPERDRTYRVQRRAQGRDGRIRYYLTLPDWIAEQLENVPEQRYEVSLETEEPIWEWVGLSQEEYDRWVTGSPPLSDADAREMINRVIEAAVERWHQAQGIVYRPVNPQPHVPPRWTQPE